MLPKFSVVLLGLLFISCKVSAYTFDPIVILAMEEAKAAIHADLALPDSAFCGVKKNSSRDIKKRRSCLVYRHRLIEYVEIINSASERIDKLKDWAPTISLFSGRNSYFVSPPHNFIPLSHLESVERLQILYDAIYAYPIQRSEGDL